ncbi:MAG: general secretion pathway protein GspB [Pseudomonadota bacterium]
MSFILDALKKSETDRQRQSSPALFEVKVAQPRRRFPLWAIGLGVLLGVNMLVLAWVLLREPRAAEAAAPVANNAPAAANYGAVNTAPPGMVTVPATVTIPTTVNIPINSAPSITMGAGAPEAGVVAPSSAPPLVEEPQLSSREPSVPPDYDARDYAPAVSVAQANRIAADRAGSIPSRDEVLAQGTQLPEVRLDLHVYAVDPAQRFVFINMRKLREGETLPEGVRVEKITPTGAQLSYRGTRFTVDGN